MPRRSLPLTRARDIAYSWHGGQDSPLYSFASTGKVWGRDHRERLLREIKNDLDAAARREHGHTAQDERDLRALLAFARSAPLEEVRGARGQRTRSHGLAFQAIW